MLFCENVDIQPSIDITDILKTPCFPCFLVKTYLHEYNLFIISFLYLDSCLLEVVLGTDPFQLDERKHNVC